MSPSYEVDIHETRPRTWRVLAEDVRDACLKALRGEGEEVSRPYVEAEITSIREEGKS